MIGETYNSLAHQIGAYHYGNQDHLATLHFDVYGRQRTFIVLISSAYNAFGLIGPEHNGIVVLDEDNRQVVLDRHTEANSGYFGPSFEQIKEFGEITSMSWEDFRAFCNKNPRSRLPI